MGLTQRSIAHRLLWSNGWQEYNRRTACISWVVWSPVVDGLLSCFGFVMQYAMLAYFTPWCVSGFECCCPLNHGFFHSVVHPCPYQRLGHAPWPGHAAYVRASERASDALSIAL